MIILTLLSSLLLPALMGCLLVLNLWAGAPTSWPARLLRLSIGLGVGLGLSALITFLGLVIAGPSTALTFGVELGLCLLLVVLLAARRVPLRALMRLRAPAWSEMDRLLLIALLCIGLAALVSMILAVLRAPHGHWDAWAIWNLHARFLYRGGAAWSALFDLQFSHPDYPLLLPALTARAWFYIGQASQAAPAMLGLLYTWLTALALVAGVAYFRQTAQGAIAGGVLLGTPFFIFQATGQLADIPTGFYLLCALLCMGLLTEATHWRPGMAALAGLAAGCAAWTKDEGLLFLFLLFVIGLVYGQRKRGWSAALVESGAFLLGALPGLLAALYVKFALAPAGKLFGELTLAGLGQSLLQPTRYFQIILAYFNGMLNFGGWPIPVGLALAGYLVLLGASPREGKRAAFTLATLLVALMLAGYFVVYLITPADLIWHLNTSLERLLLQLWPSLLLAYFLVVRLPALPEENMKSLNALFTLESLLSLQGAAVAALVVPNVLSYLIGPAFQPFQKWAAFLVAMGLSLLVAAMAAEKSWTKWLVAVFNGFLIFASAVGINQTANANLGAPPAGPQFFQSWLP